MKKPKGLVVRQKESRKFTAMAKKSGEAPKTNPRLDRLQGWTRRTIDTWSTPLPDKTKPS